LFNIFENETNIKSNSYFKNYIIAQYNTTGEVWIDQKTTVRIYPKTNSEQMGGWNNWLRDWLGVFVM
jgi:hypothetical protein